MEHTRSTELKRKPYEQTILTAQVWILVRTVAAIVFFIAHPTLQNASSVFAFEFIILTWFVCTEEKKQERETENIAGNARHRMKMDERT